MGILDKLNNISTAIEKAAKGKEKDISIKDQSETLINCSPIDTAVSQVNQQQGIAASLLSIPINDISMLGTAFAQMIPSLRTVSQSVTVNGGGYIPINNLNGEALKQFRKTTTGVFAGAFKDASTGKSTFAELVKASPETVTTNTVMPVNPAMLMMATMLVTIEHKLDDIQEVQQNILSFLEQDKQAEHQANLRFLTDTLNGYKYNWNNEQFLQNHHVKTLDIKQDSDRDVDFYQSRIASEIIKISSAHFDQAMRNSIKNLEKMFDEYRLSIYLFGFASFLEMLLLGNFQSEYLNQISDRVQKYDNQYKSHFSQCQDLVKKLSGESVETKVLAGIGNASKSLGKLISSSKAFSKGPVDEWLVNGGEKLLKGNDAKVQKTVALFTGTEDTGSHLFVENIQNICFIYNHADRIKIDSENIYLLDESENNI